MGEISLYRLLFCYGRFYKKVKKYRKNPLEQQIEIPHITFSYKPDKVEESLFGISGQGMDYRIWK